jgi:hypothetical protein
MFVSNGVNILNVDSSLKSIQQDEEQQQILHEPTLLSLPSSLSLLPFKVIKFMANQCLVPFVQSSVHHIRKRTITVQEARTSCILNMIALSIIFSGSYKAKFILDRLRYTTRVNMDIPLMDENKWQYCVNNLFSGRIIRAANKELPDRKITREFMDEQSNEYLKPFLELTKPIINSCFEIDKSSSKKEANEKIISNLENALMNLKYDFNRTIILSLKLEMEENQLKKVNDQTSFVYYLAIHVPKTHKNEKDSIEFYHAFVIEQFKTENSVLYRLYNSWINGMTLLEFFQKKNYGDSAEGCFTFEQISEFLNDVHRIVAPTTDQKEIGGLREKCFGHNPLHMLPSISFDPQKRMLKGLSFRYVSSEFNPLECFDNFNNFITIQTLDSFLN